MKKLIALSLVFLLSFPVLNAKNLTLIKSNGRTHRFSDRVTYRTVIQHFDFDGFLYYQSCMNPGHETCPPVTIITAGSFNGTDGQVTIDEIMGFAKKQFIQSSQGKAFYRGIFIAWRKAKMITFDNGNVDYEYRLFISDDIKNPRQFSGWGM